MTLVQVINIADASLPSFAVLKVAKFSYDVSTVGFERCRETIEIEAQLAEIIPAQGHRITSGNHISFIVCYCTPLEVTKVL